MSQNEQKNDLPELPEVKLSKGAWGCWIVCGLVVLSALYCFGQMVVCELERSTALWEAEKHSGMWNSSDSLCVHWKNMQDGLEISERETKKRDTVSICEKVCHVNICRADTTGGRNCFHDYLWERRSRSHMVFVWKNYLLILLGGSFCFGLIVLFYRACMAFRTDRVKIMELWRKCYMERFNYELEELRRSGAGKEKRDWEEKQKQQEQTRKMEFFRLLALMQEGKKITPETLQKLEEEYQKINKLMNNPL